MAHELGHFALDHGDSPRDTPDNFSSRTNSLQERQANQFAAELLMPADAIQEIVASGRYSLDELADIFKVSKVAMSYRITNLGSEVFRMTHPPQYDLAGGDSPPARDAKTIAEVLTEAKSRRLHRRAAAVLIYSVVLCLIASVVRVVWKVSADLVHINPAVVGLVASLDLAISVLTIALARYAYGMSNAGEGRTKSESEVTGSPAVEAVKLMGDLLSKVGDIFKSFRA